MLLAGEDLDDDIPSRSYQSLTFPSGYDSPREVNSLSMRSLHSLTPSLQSPRLLRSRGSGTGSIFHEGVWPPPGEHSRLVDPLIQASSQVDLSTIVDDVMGPAKSDPRRQNSDSSANSDQSPTVSLDSRHYDSSRGRSAASSLVGNPFDTSNTSQTRLWIPESMSSIAGQRQPRYSSPLAQTLFDRDDDNESSRNWLERSPTKRTSTLGQDV